LHDSCVRLPFSESRIHARNSERFPCRRGGTLLKGSSPSPYSSSLWAVRPLQLGCGRGVCRASMCVRLRPLCARRPLGIQNHVSEFGTLGPGATAILPGADLAHRCTAHVLTRWGPGGLGWHAGCSLARVAQVDEEGNLPSGEGGESDGRSGAGRRSGCSARRARGTGGSRPPTRWDRAEADPSLN
jgi:hypothetical protein